MPASDVHPDLRRAARFIPKQLVSPVTLPMLRIATRRLGRHVPRDVEVLTLPSGVGVRLHRPPTAAGPGPALLWIHGGGYVMGSAAQDDGWCRRYARALGATVAAVEYRLAPEHPYPAPLEDCYTALAWLIRLPGVDPARVAIGGASAGGGLAAALALRARDQQGPPIRFQLLSQPGLDDRQETWSARNFTDTPWMNRDKVTASWRHYLGDTPATPYAAPARAADLSGLPPAHIASAELCPNRDENIIYALRLLQAGVSVELHQWAGTFHGSQAILSAEVSQRQITELAAALRRALAE